MRRPEGSDRFDSRYTTKTVKHPDSVMVWGCFTGSVGRGGLFFLPKNVTMNGERYQDVLENHLLPTLEIKKLWINDLSRDYFKKLRDSMPGRLEKVIAAKGDMTKY